MLANPPPPFFNAMAEMRLAEFLPMATGGIGGDPLARANAEDEAGPAPPDGEPSCPAPPPPLPVPPPPTTMDIPGAAAGPAVL